jgi:hypothetical protein
MENRTELKEKRNGALWTLWFMVLLSSIVFTPFYIEEESKEVVLLTSLSVCLVSIVYRVLTYCLNCFLRAVIKKRFKINRLKGRITPIYKLIEYERYFEIVKYSAKYTPLDLQWSIPFSVLFEEQEYVKEGCEEFEMEIQDGTDIKKLYDYRKELKANKNDIKETEENLRKQRIDKLNKEFNENYK